MSPPDFEDALKEMISDWYFRLELYDWLRKTLRVKYSTDVIRYYLESVVLENADDEPLNTYQLWKNTKLQDKPKQNPPKNTFYLRTVPYLIELGFLERRTLGLGGHEAAEGRKEDQLTFNRPDLVSYVFHLAEFLRDTE
jgi:hypothetical protein